MDYLLESGLKSRVECKGEVTRRRPGGGGVVIRVNSI